MVALLFSWCLWQWRDAVLSPWSAVIHSACSFQWMKLKYIKSGLKTKALWILIRQAQSLPLRGFYDLWFWDEEAPLCPPTGKKISERWFNFTGHKVIHPLPPLLLLVYYGGKLPSSPSIFCQQMEIVLSCAFLLPPSLLLASLTSHSVLTWVLKSRLAIGSWKQSVGQTLGGILSERCGEGRSEWAAICAEGIT